MLSLPIGCMKFYFQTVCHHFWPGLILHYKLRGTYLLVPLCGSDMKSLGKTLRKRRTTQSFIHQQWRPILFFMSCPLLLALIQRLDLETNCGHPKVSNRAQLVRNLAWLFCWPYPWRLCMGVRTKKWVIILASVLDDDGLQSTL